LIISSKVFQDVFIYWVYNTAKVIKYAARDVREMAHKEEELNRVLNEKKIKVAATIESQK
jgi:hypothetical protein